MAWKGQDKGAPPRLPSLWVLTHCAWLLQDNPEGTAQGKAPQTGHSAVAGGPRKRRWQSDGCARAWVAMLGIHKRVCEVNKCRGPLRLACQLKKYAMKYTEIILSHKENRQKKINVENNKSNNFYMLVFLTLSRRPGWDEFTSGLPYHKGSLLFTLPSHSITIVNKKVLLGANTVKGLFPPLRVLH